ncbi:MAG: hypothetical protein H0T70_06015 [Acidimicrobiia bacterium]|nr:hypothetical protein [Acidimicrobiia bacterium]
MAPEHRTPPALAVSVLFGVVGVVLVVTGLVADSNSVAVAGVGAGTVSLISALVWREQLIAAWEARRGKNQAD